MTLEIAFWNTLYILFRLFSCDVRMHVVDENKLTLAIFNESIEAHKTSNLPFFMV